MNYSKLLIALATALYVATPSFATDLAEQLSAAYNDCAAGAQSSVMGLKECADTETKQLKIQLKSTLKRTASVLSNPRKAALKKAQAAWEKYHAANCDFYIDEDAGQMATLGMYQCDLNMYAARIKELKDASGR